MRRIHRFAAALSGMLISPLLFGQNQTPTISEPDHGIFGTRKYRPETVAPIDLSNTARLENLLRAGNLYLSLQEVIALALENNLDIAIARYGPAAAEQDLRRARAGGALRGVNTNVTTGPTSAAPISINAFSTNTAAGGAAGGAATGAGGSVNGIISQLGPTIPNYDPVLTGNISY